MSKPFILDNYIKRVSIVHNNKYDYSLVGPKRSDRIWIICPIHGKFEQDMYGHARGYGCFKCGIKKRIKPASLFIEKAKKIHGDKYDYSLIKYKNSLSIVSIVCPIHGKFKQKCSDHLSGSGCQKCGVIISTKHFIKTTDSFIQRSKNIHIDPSGNPLFSYEKSIYVNILTPIIVTCKIHGDFYVTPRDHLQKTGCKKCSTEKKQKVFQILLKKLKKFTKINMTILNVYIDTHI